MDSCVTDARFYYYSKLLSYTNSVWQNSAQFCLLGYSEQAWTKCKNLFSPQIYEFQVETFNLLIIVLKYFYQIHLVLLHIEIQCGNRLQSRCQVLSHSWHHGWPPVQRVQHVWQWCITTAAPRSAAACLWRGASYITVSTRLHSSATASNSQQGLRCTGGGPNGIQVVPGPMPTTALCWPLPNASRCLMPTTA